MSLAHTTQHNLPNRIIPPPPPRQHSTPQAPPPQHNEHISRHKLKKKYKSTSSFPFPIKQSLTITHTLPQISDISPRDGLPLPHDHDHNTNSFPHYAKQYVHHSQSLQSLQSFPSPTPLPSPVSPGTPGTPRKRNKYLKKHQTQPILSNIHRSSRSSSASSNGSNGSNGSNYSNYSYHRRSSTPRNHKTRSNIMCICGRRMDYTQNPMNKYPPNAVFYCQQSSRCKKKIIVQKDWFYCCKSRTSYHGTKDGRFKICYSCSISNENKQLRIRKNHQLLIKQLKNKHNGKVLITKDTKDYILSSTAHNSKDETLRLLKETYIDNNNINKNNKNKKKERKSMKKIKKIKKNDRNKVIMEGFMMKKGNFWNKAFKKRYFKLWGNKQLYYYRHYDDESGIVSDERGVADLKVINNIIKKGKNGLEIVTPAREWKFLCNSHDEREKWYKIVSKLCMGNKLKKAKTFSSLSK